MVRLKKVVKGKIFIARMSISVVPRSEARRARRAGSSKSAWDCPRLHRQQTLALQLFAGELAGAADGFRLLPDSPLGGFFVMAAEFHLAEYALALHLLLQHLKGLVALLSRTRTCTRCSSSIERLKGPPRCSGHWRTDTHNSGAKGHQRYEPTSIFESVPADGHHGCQL